MTKLDILCPNCGKEMIKTSNRLTEIVCVVLGSNRW